ncbi:SufE family protein [Methylobacterium durans]|uniref:Cysteine desulfuration protein SufE n=1 Tax=Methylobacterium durans TaxID=2202825 RepID=A0A2U8W537_9HYPH|nr:SufE family protein [Methylobacterium durans]AWN41224.1 cysteine desulfuration protein SufE [Methylobacterium durans]
MLAPLPTIIENFEFMDEWEDRYAYVIELGREMPRLPPERCTEENRVHGCESQVWLESRLDESGGKPILTLEGESDSSITRGLVALMIAIYAGKSPEEIAATDGLDVFRQLDFSNHITSKRAGGLRAMNERIQREAHKLSA